MVNGAFVVTETCGHASGPPRVSTIKAAIVPGSANAKFRMSILGGLAHPEFWIVDTAPSGDWAIMATPGGHYVWLLSRASRDGAYREESRDEPNRGAGLRPRPSSRRVDRRNSRLAVDADSPRLPCVEQILCRAIRTLRVVRFTYEGAVRTAEPHIVGCDHQGRRLLSAWQLSGGSGEAFRSYGLDKLSQLPNHHGRLRGSPTGVQPRARHLRPKDMPSIGFKPLERFRPP